jgi:integrase
MGSIRKMDKVDKLFFDFRYRGARCREYTLLTDTAANRKNMEKMLAKIESEINADTFDYARYFPNSPMVGKFLSTKTPANAPPQQWASTIVNIPTTPLFKEFAEEWYLEHEIEWKRSYRSTLKFTFKKYLLSVFGEIEVSRITKGEILKFRSSLAKVPNGTKTGLSPDRINHIMTPLRMILAEAADRYNFTTTFVGIKQLRVPKSDVDPFSLDEVNHFLANVRPDFRNYYTVRFLTGMRTGEIDGLKWKYINFERREIYIRETIVYGLVETAKTIGSERTIQIPQPVVDALKTQLSITGHLNGFVFCNNAGSPFDYHNINNRIWYPTLKRLGLKRRRAYQTRHTTATLWLASGENPEWIARQMGHSSTRMLFTIYSRFVPNLTRQDGSAFERLLMAQQSQEVNNDNR